MVQWSKSSLRAFQRRLLDFHLRLGLVQGGDGGVVVGGRDEFAVEQRFERFASTCCSSREALALARSPSA